MIVLFLTIHKDHIYHDNALLLIACTLSLRVTVINFENKFCPDVRTSSFDVEDPGSIPVRDRH